MATTFKSAVLESKLTINEELGGANVVGQVAIIDDLNETIKIDSGSTPDGAYAFTADKAMTGSVVTIDFLDALVDTEGNTITMTTQRVRAIKFKAPTTNAGSTTITYGASNPLLIGGAAFKWILSPGQSILCYLENDGEVIDATHCNVDCTGTNNDILEFAIVCG
jgi:hypothetical protein